jgi:pimeloyl-ACP methyl ester carboxylesterase
MGVSGGGPHALACAHCLGDRLLGTAVVSGLAPISRDPRRFTEDMMGFNRLMFRLARRSSLLPTLIYTVGMAVVRRSPDRALQSMLRDLPPPDIEVISRLEVRATFVREMARFTATAGRAGGHEFALFTRDWGFQVEDISVPVHVWHGDQDRNVPIANGRFLAAAIPGSVLHECPGEGHLLNFDHNDEILLTITKG